MMAAFAMPPLRYLRRSCATRCCRAFFSMFALPRQIIFAMAADIDFDAMPR